ncbi:hypothetical protein [Enterobacter hormaechei]|uniref:hypothetical protein n=1 Tax=Enterobacter hormaechei TaxID=158836 RepID=UPI0039065CC7
MSKFTFPFSVVSACGVFVVLASGIEWGTPECGGVAALTLVIACASGALNATR